MTHGGVTDSDELMDDDADVRLFLVLFIWLKG